MTPAEQIDRHKNILMETGAHIYRLEREKDVYTLFTKAPAGYVLNGQISRGEAMTLIRQANTIYTPEVVR